MRTRKGSDRKLQTPAQATTSFRKGVYFCCSSSGLCGCRATHRFAFHTAVNEGGAIPSSRSARLSSTVHRNGLRSYQKAAWIHKRDRAMNVQRGRHLSWQTTVLLHNAICQALVVRTPPSSLFVFGYICFAYVLSLCDNAAIIRVRVGWNNNQTQNNNNNHPTHRNTTHGVRDFFWFLLLLMLL